MKKLILLLFIPLVFTCSSDSSDDSSSCPNQPQLTTNEVTNISFDAGTGFAGATLSGEILNIELGSNCETFSITNQGFVYSTGIQPTIEDNVVNANGESVTISYDNFLIGKTYYVRTFITNVLGTFYGNEVSFATPNPVYVDDNGITIKATDWAEVGMSGEIDGVTYTVVDRQILQELIEDDDDVTVVCTSKITTMDYLFGSSWGASFNQDISNWDVSNVTNMQAMFYLNGTFNTDISAWDVSNVNEMNGMFYGAVIFNKDLSSWNVSNVISCSSFCQNAFEWTLPKPNFTNCGDIGCD